MFTHFTFNPMSFLYKPSWQVVWAWPEQNALYCVFLGHYSQFHTYIPASLLNWNTYIIIIMKQKEHFFSCCKLK